MKKSTNLNKNTHTKLLSIKSAIVLLTFLLLTAGSIFLTACSKPSSPKVQTTESQTKTKTDMEALKTSIDKTVIGVIKVKGGAMLERDIIPQLCVVFSLPEQEVKDTLAAVGFSNLINTQLTDFRRMEGMILPGEYEITKGITLKDEVSTWVSQSEKRYNELLSSNTNPNTLTPANKLALASMVEAECLAGTHQEEVATVFLNRLEDGSKLQSCVTAEYALGYQRPYLTIDDISKVSDYNTYHISGLPIGPICAISDASLKAAISKKMDKHIYYFYYDYILNDMFFFDDYKKFNDEGSISVKRFEAKSTVDKRAKINKQALYH